MLPPISDVTHITLAHCDAVGRGYPPHQFSVTINSSGLGLNTTKQLMDLLGGSVGFRSTEGKGSTFWIELGLLPEPRDDLGQ